MTLDWDKHADMVMIGDRTFARSVGNILVVKREHAGVLVSTQLPSVTADLGPDRVIRYIQTQTGNDMTIAAVRLPQRN